MKKFFLIFFCGVSMALSSCASDEVVEKKVQVENTHAQASFLVRSAKIYNDQKTSELIKKNLPDTRVLLQVQLQVRGEGSEVFPFHRSNFSLLLPSGEQVDESPLADLPEFSDHLVLTKQLEKAMLLEGALYFEVPKDVEVSLFQLQYESFTSDRRSKLYQIPLL